MSLDYPTLAVRLEGALARVDLNRPEARNAMNAQMVADLYACFRALRENRSIRVVVLGGAGAAFCAGGDLHEMQEPARERPFNDAGQIDDLLAAVNHAPQVVIARVHGPALGGGLGLVCVADIALAASQASLGFPEARLGMAPAMISPYVVARIGLAQARRWMLTGALLDGDQAAAAGLVSESCPAEELDSRVGAVVRAILQCSPAALAACKALLFEVAGRPPAETAAYRADLLAQMRASPEGQEGMAAFLQKRKPGWVVE